MKRSKRKKSTSTLKKIVLTLVGVLAVILIGSAAFLGKTYYDVKNVANKVSQPLPEGLPDDTNIMDGEPFSVLLLGLDTGEFGRSDLGRSDTMMVATVNPKEKKTTLVSIPRDTRTEIVGNDSVEKIAHAYAYGQEKMAIETTQKLLDIPINHYVWINMEGFEDLVNAVDGVEIDNDFEFEQDGYTFKPGKQHLNGKESLAYTRMRYEDPKGDYGRQDRQREVVEAIVDKGLTFTGFTRYQKILKAIEENMRTDLEWKEMKAILMGYRECFYNIEEETLQGYGEMIDDGDGNGPISYQIIPDDELERVQKMLQDQLK